MKAIVLCAGKGTRLRELTEKIPKPMLPIGQKPLLAYTISYLARFGFTDISINLNFCPDQITGYFKDGSDFGVNIHYSHENQLLGTAGAVAKLADWVGNEDCLVIYGDIFTDQDLQPLIEKHSVENSFATIFVHKRNSSNSIVRIDGKGRVISFKERPTEEEKAVYLAENGDFWVNSAVQILSPESVNYIVESAAFDLPCDVYAKVFDRENIFAVGLTGFRVAIDSPQRYQLACRAVENGDYKYCF